MNPISLRLLNQQLVAPQYDTPTEVVSHMGAIQAQEYRMMRWTVGMRTRKPSSKAFKEAFDSGEIVRLHLMRGTWQLVTAQDYWYFLEICAPRAIAVTKGWMSSNRITIPDDEITLVRDIITQTAADKGSATKEDFTDALARENILIDDHRLSYHIRLCEMTGQLCSGKLLPMKATYSLTANKVGPRPFHIDPDEALSRLTRKYFQSHQPATLEDFVWWSGLGIGDCRKGIELASSTIYSEEWRGYRFYLTDKCRIHGFRKGKYLFIPPYDEYLIGYKSRDIVLSPEHKHKAHNNNGVFYPVIAGDGIICGNWRPYENDISTMMFEGQECHERQKSIDLEWERYKNFLRIISKVQKSKFIPAIAKGSGE